MRGYLAAGLVVLLSACGGSDTPSDETTDKAVPVPVEAPDGPPPAPEAEAASPTATSLFASVQVVDLEGAPLPNMAPIATKEPNAFDAPVATGSATNPEGRGTIRVPTTEHLYLRAFDPTLNYFPNNFYEVLPGGGKIEGELVIQMVPAASLSVQLILPNNQPAANMAVGLMLYHPTRGPWWPAEAQSNADGFVTFPHLPAGEFVLRMKVASGARLEHPQTALAPRSAVDLGVLSLQ